MSICTQKCYNKNKDIEIKKLKKRFFIMNFFTTGRTSLQNVTVKFTKHSSPYDIYKKINEYYAKNDNNNRVLLKICVNGVENIRIYKNSIVIRNFLDSDKSISLKINKYKDYFMNNLCQNHEKFEYFVRNHQKYAFSVIDFLGNPFIFIKTTSVIKDFHFLWKIKATFFKNINKYIDFHDNQEKLFAPTSVMSVNENKVCKGCDICRAIHYLGKLLEDKRYSKICVWKNRLISKNHCAHVRAYIKNSLSSRTDLSKISALKLCWCVPYMALFFNLEMPQVEYTKQILGMKSNNENTKITHIKQELIKRNIIYVKQHGSDNDFSRYREYIFHEPQIHHTKQQHRQMKISVQFADGHEQVFESISECAKYFGYSNQLVAYHLDKLHSPLDHKIFQSF